MAKQIRRIATLSQRRRKVSSASVVTRFEDVLTPRLGSGRKPKYRKILWEKLEDEPLSPGDFWVIHDTDPNEPEKQSSDLQMQGVYRSHYGIPAKDVIRGNGDYWRPVGFVEVFKGLQRVL